MYEKEIEKIKLNLKNDIDDILRIKALDLLRYYLDCDTPEKDKVIYVPEILDVSSDRLECCEAIEVSKECIKLISKIIKDHTELTEIMYNNYYYLGKYLFSYFARAIEIGIPKEKQFLAPRVCVLGPICYELEKFYYKPRGILTVSMPQGTGKTEIGKRFMAFCIGKEPDMANMMISYSAAIAKDKFYNGAITIIEDENGNYQRIFQIKNVMKNAETMSLDYRNDGKIRPHSEYTLYCAGFDGGITGRTRAHNVLYIDDLVKNIEEARNKEVLDKKWEEFTATLKKRMQGNCKMLIIGTIFSIHDPISRLIQFFKENDPLRIKTIRIPGLNSKNVSNFNYTHNFAITTEMFLEDKALMDTVSFECLIQQNPMERLGILFSEDELSKFEKLPEEGFDRNIASVDVAWGGGDSLSMPICSEYKNGDCFLIDAVHHKGPKEITIPIVVNAIIKYRITRCHFEANNGGDMYAEAVEKKLHERNYIDCVITHSKVPTTKAKRDRILAAAGAIKGAIESAYRLYIYKRICVKNNEMYNKYLDELTHYNQSDNMQNKKNNPDDAPDSASSLFSNVLGVQLYGKAKSSTSREALGI